MNWNVERAEGRTKFKGKVYVGLNGFFLTQRRRDAEVLYWICFSYANLPSRRHGSWCIWHFMVLL